MTKTLAMYTVLTTTKYKYSIIASFFIDESREVGQIVQVAQLRFKSINTFPTQAPGWDVIADTDLCPEMVSRAT